MELRERILGVLERDQLRALTFIFPVQVDRRRPEEMRAALAATPERVMPVEALLKALDTSDLEQVCARLGVSAGRSRASMLGALLAAPGSDPPVIAPIPAEPAKAPRPWPEVERQIAPEQPIPQPIPQGIWQRGLTWDPGMGPPEPPDEDEPPQLALFSRPERPAERPAARSAPHTWAARSVEEHRSLPGAVRALPPKIPALPPKMPVAAPVANPAAPAIPAAPAGARPAAPVAAVPPPAARPAGARRSFTAIDFETADNGRDSACSVALVRVVGGEIKEVESFLIRPPRAAFLFTHIHGITWEMVKGEPTFKQRWPQIQRMLEGSELLVAHNASFDRSVLEACCRAAGLPGVSLPFECTVQAAKRKWSLSSAKLPVVCDLLKIPLQHHDARSDAMACAKIAIASGVDLR